LRGRPSELLKEALCTLYFVKRVLRQLGVTWQLFTGIQMVVNFWLFHNGFSIGIGDRSEDYTLRPSPRESRKVIEEATHDPI
jgi:hypothetical protein